MRCVTLFYLAWLTRKWLDRMEQDPSIPVTAPKMMRAHVGVLKLKIYNGTSSLFLSWFN